MDIETLSLGNIFSVV